MRKPGTYVPALLAGALFSLFMTFGVSGAKAQETVKGEKLDPSTYGPCWIESMEAAIERDRAVQRPLPPEGKDRNGRHGVWVVPGMGASTSPHSGNHYAVNKWGDTCMGIRFPGLVEFEGAWIAGQSARGAWTTGVKIKGYRGDALVKETPWFTKIGEEPAWMAADLHGVDRIEVISRPVFKGGGWYALDDLTFTSLDPGTGKAEGKKRVIDFEDLPYRFTLTGSGYAGLTWEEGRGAFQEEGVHAPKTPLREKEGGEAAGLTAPHRAQNGTLPNLKAAYQGVIRGDAGSMSYPPDTIGAVGPNHFVETVNRNFAVYDKATGAELTNILLGSFLPGSNGDPRVLFDQHSGRWIVIVCDFNATASIFLAVSLTDNPMGSWFKGSFVTAQGSDTGKWPDYPTLGVDKNGIYTAAYMVGSGDTMTLFAIDKAPLVGSSPHIGTITAFRSLSWEGAIQPAHTYGDPGGEYCISWYNSSALRLRRVNPPLTAPTLTQVGIVSVPSFSNPPNAPAKGSSVPLNTVDDRLMMAVYRDGSLWTAHTIAAGAGAGCRWYEIDTASATRVQSGTVTDPALYFFFPSIMVNKNGDAAMGFSGSNTSQYAGCYYTGRLASDPPGEMAAPAQYKPGTGPQNNVDPYGRNRWGDYSYTTLDPSDETTFWTIQEYGHSSDIWGTYAAVLEPQLPALSLALQSTMPDHQNPGIANHFTLEIQDGLEHYQAGTGTLFYRFDGGAFQAVSLASLGGNLYEGVLPHTEPGDLPEFYFSAQGDGGTTVTLPKDAPSTLFSFEVYFAEILFEDDFETDKGWTVYNDPSLVTGAFERADPQGTSAQPEDDHSAGGTRCYVTGHLDGNIGDHDVDGGPTILISPELDLSGGDGVMTFYVWFYHSDNGTFQPLRIQLSDDGGSTWTLVEDMSNSPAWNLRTVKVSDFVSPTEHVKIRFRATDNPNDSVVEALVDDFTVERRIYDAALWADTYTLSAAVGGTLNFTLDGGTGNAGRQYLLLGSMSGTAPGFPLPGGGATVPLNWDTFTDFVLTNLTNPVFLNFMGMLDGTGRAQAGLDTYGPLNSAFIGVKLCFAFILSPNPTWNFASNAMTVTIEP